MHQLDCKLKPEITAYESNCDIQQNYITEANTEARSKSDLVNSGPIKAEVIAPVEITPKVEQARVKKGKLAHIASNLNTLFYHSKTLEDLQIGEGINVDEKTSSIILYLRKHKLSMLEKNRLHTTVQKHRSQHSANVNFANDVSIDIATNCKIHIQDITDQLFRICQNLSKMILRMIKLNT